eukprot:15470796-Alexandrium_andersonii.AAC.2
MGCMRGRLRIKTATCMVRPRAGLEEQTRKGGSRAKGEATGLRKKQQHTPQHTHTRAQQSTGLAATKARTSPQAGRGAASNSPLQAVSARPKTHRRTPTGSQPPLRMRSRCRSL